MKQKRVFLTCGPAGCGKSSWIRERINKYGGYHVSRDMVRFNLLGEGEDYFSHEDEVFEKFIEQAQLCIDMDEDTPADIYIDATHLFDGSRRKTLKALKNLDKCYLIGVYFTTPIEICKYRNNLRSGLALVPDEVIDNQFRRYNTNLKGFDEVWEINMEGEKVN